MDSTSPSNTIRRLSLQFGKKSHMMVQVTRNLLQHARSVVIFPFAVGQVPAAGSCRVLRVLDLEHCNLSHTDSLKYLGNLYQLRYLRLYSTHISQLPEEIGNLQFLQTLDVRSNPISILPSSVVQLRNLMCLDIGETTRVPNGIGNLTCLEQLSWLCIDGSTINNIEELGQLTELRRLWVKLDEWNDKLLGCLHKLQKIQELDIEVHRGLCNIGGLDAWVAPRHLRLLDAENICWFSTLPAWVNPSFVPVLTCLRIAVRELHQVDLDILGRLPALRRLWLEVDNKKLGILQGLIVSPGSFPCLEFCRFFKFIWPVVFQKGAMPRLARLGLWRLFYAREARGIASKDGGLDLGLGNLPSLQPAGGTCLLMSYVKALARRRRSKLTHAAEMHPSHPHHNIRICVY